MNFSISTPTQAWCFFLGGGGEGFMGQYNYYSIAIHLLVLSIQDETSGETEHFSLFMRLKGEQFHNTKLYIGLVHMYDCT